MTKKYSTIGKITGILLASCTLAACGQKSELPEVRWYGGLHNMMMQGDISAKVAPDSLLTPETWGLGAAAELDGEILIEAGNMHMSRVRNDSIITHAPANSKATLLVYSRIEHWYPTAILPPGSDANTIAEEIKSALQNAQQPDSTAVAFRLRGPVQQLSWHVIAWPAGDSVHTHAKHKSSGKRGHVSNAEVEITGFYSQIHGGIFTHRGSPLHMHFRDQEKNLIGHVDAIAAGDPMQLLLPFK